MGNAIQIVIDGVMNADVSNNSVALNNATGLNASTNSIKDYLDSLSSPLSDLDYSSSVDMADYFEEIR